MADHQPPAPILPSLLARKGEARPAMRRNGQTGGAVEDDDLGWNDLGQPCASAPPVLQQRAQLRALATDAPVVDAVTIHPDADQLWRLRLAAAARNMTVEAFVMDAVDQVLPSVSDVAALVQRLAAASPPKVKP
jgi:hypothetical protein